MAEIWFRSPQYYARELIECNETRIIFDYGYMVKRRLDAQKWCDLHFGSGANAYRLIVAAEQGSPEFRPGISKRIASYPTWRYGDDEGILESYCVNNIGDDEELCAMEPSPTMTEEMIPVFGQEHRIIVMNFPKLSTGPGKQFIRMLKGIQEDYPDVIIHLHGAATFDLPARMGFASFDFEPRIPAASGAFYIPPGKMVMKNENRLKFADWLKVLGFKPVDMDEPRNRCMANIRSASWAAANFGKDTRITIKPTTSVDTTTPTSSYDPADDKSDLFKKVIPKPGDRVACDSCSLSMACKLYRKGSVCTVPNSEPRELAAYFRTRDASTIIDGLAEVLAVQLDRLKEGRQAEQDLQMLDPEVTRIANSAFKQGDILARLVDPTLRNPKVQINVGNNGGQTAVHLGDPRQFIANAVRELELMGFRRDQITPDVIQAMMTGNVPQAPPKPELMPRVIEHGES